MTNLSFKSLIIVCIFGLALASCASTKITCNDPQAEIYLDNELIGKGEASIRSMGFPNTVEIEARKSGVTLGKVTMSRKFTKETFGWGLISWGTGFLWGWYYPDMVAILVSPTNAPGTNKTSPWEKPREKEWGKP